MSKKITFAFIIIGLAIVLMVFNNSNIDNVDVVQNKELNGKANEQISKSSDKHITPNAPAQNQSSSIVSRSFNNLEPEIQQALQQNLNTSSDGLIEEKTQHSVNVGLQGRFKSMLVATISEEGDIEIRDYTSVPSNQGARQ